MAAAKAAVPDAPPPGAPLERQLATRVTEAAPRRPRPAGAGPTFYGPLVVAVVENTSVRLARLPSFALTKNGLNPGLRPLPA